MAINSKYVFTTGNNFLDLNLDYQAVSLAGQSVQIVGSSDIDSVFVRPGTSVDFTRSGGGADKLYLGGNLSDYSFAMNGSVLEISRGSGATLEFARVSGSSNDLVIFANGSLVASSISAWASSLVAPATPLPQPVPAGETSLSPNLPVTTTGVATFAAYGATTFAPVDPGIAVTLLGSSEVDKVFVKAGATVNATNLGGSQDLIFFTGRWSDYTKSTSGTQLVFERDINGNHERVVVAQGNGGSSTDKLIFADGSAGAYVAGVAIRAAAAAGVAVAPLSSLADFDALTVTPGTGVQTIALSPVPGQDPVVNSQEPGVDIRVAYANIHTGDLVQLKLGQSNLGAVRMVTAAEALAGAVTFNVARAALGGDGVKHVTASVAGEAGTSTSGELLITLDTLAPVAAQLVAASAQVNAASATAATGAVSVVAEADSSVRVVFTVGSSSVTKVLTGTGSVQPVVLTAADVAALGDGTVSVQAVVTDRAGNVGVAGSTSFVLDTVAPLLPAVGPIAGDNVINASEQNVVISGTTEAGSTVALHFGTATVAATVVGTSWSYTLTPADVAQLPQGAATIGIVSTDRAGNVSPVLSRSVTVDTVIPHGTTIERATTTGVDAAGNTNSRGTLDFVVTFDDASVLHAETASNWVATFNGATVAAAVTAAQALGAGRYLVSVDASKIGAVDGTLTVALAASHTVVDAAGNPAVLAAAASPATSYVIDHFDSAPVFSSATRNVTFAENTPVSSVVFSGGATDADLTAPNNVISYSLGGADVGLFDINTTTGAVTFLESPDYETAAHGGHFSVNLVATDGAGRSAVQAVTVDLADVNDAPVVGTHIAAQVAGIGQTFSFTLPTGAFVDEDAAGSSNHALTYSATLAGGGALPSWLHFDAATATFSGTFASAAHLDIAVTATDGGVVPLSASQTFGIDAVPPVTLSSSINHVANFDVGSSLVLSASEDVTAVAGKFIHLVDLGASAGAGSGFGGESTNHTQTISVTDASQVTIVGNRIVINPNFDLDLSSSYQITVDDGAFLGASTHLGSVAVGPASGTPAIGFDTVTPGGGAGSTVASAASSVAFDTGTGQLHSSYNWWNIEGVGLSYSKVSSDVSASKVAMVFKDWNSAGGDNVARTDGVGVNQSFGVNVTGFGADDLIYIDDQGNNPLQANLLQWTDVNNSGTQPGTLAFDPAPGVGAQGIALIDVSLAGNSLVFASVSELNALLGTQAVISG